MTEGIIIAVASVFLWELGKWIYRSCENEINENSIIRLKLVELETKINLLEEKNYQSRMKIITEQRRD